MWLATMAVMTGTALAWFILFLISLAVLLWFISWFFFPVEEPVPVSQSLQGLTGLDQVTACRLATFGVSTDRNLIRLTPRGQQELESQLDLHNGEYDGWKREILARWRKQYLPTSFRELQGITPDPELGGVYTKRPKETDDLTKLGGVEKIAASRLNNAGIYTFEQFRLMTPEQRACVKQKFNLSGIDFDKVPEFGVTAQWLAFLGNEKASSVPAPNQNATPDKNATVEDAKIVATSFASSHAIRSAAEHNESLESLPMPDRGIPHSRMDDELGRVYTTAPPHQDDLTQVDGLDAVAAERLNAVGIYTEDQIQSLSLSQRASFKRRFDLPHFDFSQWSKGTVVPRPHIETRPDSQVAETQSILDSRSEHTDKANEYASSLGSKKTVTGFSHSPKDIEVPSSEVTPVTASEEDASVISTAGAATVSAIAKVAGKIPVGQGGDNISSLGFPCSGPRSGRPDDADVLQRLPHVDSAVAKRLNDAGVYTFEQLSGLSLAQQTQLRVGYGLADVDFPEWQRLIYAWSRGVDTALEAPARMDRTGWLHSVRLTEIADRVFDGRLLVAYPEQVVFRGMTPQHWGTTVREARAGVTRSIAATEVRNDINYVRIRRLDTRDSVVTEINMSQLYAPGSQNQNGWNGLGERYFGARHLGVFAKGVPAEVETKFGLGGWGFGHAAPQDEGQACCWHGRIIPSTALEISVGRIRPASGTIVFRSSDPTIWNQAVRVSTDHWAMPVCGVSHPVSFVRIMRVDTGQAVIVKTDSANVATRGADPRVGWNGLNEHFYGGHHLGVYQHTAPQAVEVAYGEGGWGFGHRYGSNDSQAYGWAGRTLPKTVFEISLLERLPDHLQHEVIG